MPIREFRCRDCRTVFEALIFNPRDEACERCRSCGGGKLERMYSLFGVSGTARKVVTTADCSSCVSRNCGSCGSGVAG